LRISFERLFQPLSPIIRLLCAPLFPAFMAVEMASVPVLTGFVIFSRNQFFSVRLPGRGIKSLPTTSWLAPRSLLGMTSSDLRDWGASLVFAFVAISSARSDRQNLSDTGGSNSFQSGLIWADCRRTGCRNADGGNIFPRQAKAAKDVTKFDDERRGAVVEHELDIILSNPDQSWDGRLHVRSRRIAAEELWNTRIRARVVRSRNRQKQRFACL